MLQSKQTVKSLIRRMKAIIYRIKKQIIQLNKYKLFITKPLYRLENV